MSADLYHFTCGHGADGINRQRVVRPCRQVVADVNLSLLPPDLLRFCWFTDLDVPMRDALGLTSETIDCDRTAYRFRAIGPNALTPWRKVRRSVDSTVRTLLETAEGAMPSHWWVAESPVRVEPCA